MINYQQDRVRGSLVGGAIGDALGFPVEFLRTYEIIQKYYGKEGITTMDIVNNTGKALISDDTQMTLFTACGLLNAKEHGMNPLSATTTAYLEWLDTQKDVQNKQQNFCWIADIPELYEQRAPGITCMEALEQIQSGREPKNDSKGCGGIMRIAPVALWGLPQGDILVLNKLAADIARMTHKHPLGYIPAFVQSHLIFRLALDYTPTRETFKRYLNESMAAAKAEYPNYINECNILQDLLDKAILLADIDGQDHMAIEKIGQGWVAEETLAIAVYCTYKYIDDFEKAVIAAVNHAGDSDSTGAVTGNLVGAAVGYDAIPTHFKENLELHDVILHIADDLWRGHNTPY